MPTLWIDRGDRRPLEVKITRSGTDPAGPVQFQVGADAAWINVNPADPAPNPATYELLLAHGTDTDFAAAHPTGTITIAGTVLVRMRPPTGRDIDAQDVAWVVTR